MLDNIKREPALVTSTVAAIITLLVAFGVPITDDQRAALIGAAMVITGLVIRQQVTPNIDVAARDTGGGRIVSGPADDAAPDGHPVVVQPADGAGEYVGRHLATPTETSHTP